MHSLCLKLQVMQMPQGSLPCNAIISLVQACSNIPVYLQLDGCMLKWLQKILWHCAATICT